MITTKQKTIDTQIRSLSEVVANDTFFVDLEYAVDLYWDENFYYQDNWECRDTHNISNHQVESDDFIRDAHVSDALRYALIGLWTVNSHLPNTLPLPNFPPRPQNRQKQLAVFYD